MKRIIIFNFIIFFYSLNIFSQKYEDFIGAGHFRDIKVMSSSQKSDYPNIYTAKAVNTINGKGLDDKMMEVSRFLSHATLGPNMELIKEVENIGIEPWLDQQLETQGERYLDNIRDIYQLTTQWELSHGVDSTDIDDRANWSHYMYTWWEYNIFNDDLVRQKAALALSEILVLSFDSELSGFGEGVASYYDILSQNAFGNYTDLKVNHWN